MYLDTKRDIANWNQFLTFNQRKNNFVVLQGFSLPLNISQSKRTIPLNLENELMPNLFRAFKVRYSRKHCRTCDLTRTGVNYCRNISRHSCFGHPVPRFASGHVKQLIWQCFRKIKKTSLNTNIDESRQLPSICSHFPNGYRFIYIFRRY